MISTTSPAPAPRRRRAAAGEVRLVTSLLAAGLLVGALWALSAPSLARSASLGEQRIAVDGLLALLGVVAGLLTALLFLVAPGPRPPLRLAVLLVAATAANLLAAGIGSWVGHLSLRATGVALLWPLVTAVIVALRTVASFVAHPDDDAPRSPRRHAGAFPPEGADAAGTQP